MYKTLDEIQAQLEAQDRTFDGAVQRLREAPSDVELHVDRADLEAIDEAAQVRSAPVPANPGLRC